VPAVQAPLKPVELMPMKTQPTPMITQAPTTDLEKEKKRLMQKQTLSPHQLAMQRRYKLKEGLLKVVQVQTIITM
jgi:hypothetical protein